MKNTLPAALILSLLSSAALAQTVDDIARVDVLPGWQTADGTHMAGLRVTLAPGWKTYWRAPGDAGIPPTFTYGGSQNIAGVQYHWPVPQVFHQSGMRSIGYHDGVVIPVEITPSADGSPIHLAGEISIGVCEEICVPMHLTFDAALPAVGSRDGAITASLLNQPVSAASAGIGPATCAMTATSRGVMVTASIPYASANGTPDVVIEAGDPHIWVSEPDVTRQGNQLIAMSEMVHSSGGGFALDRSALRITLIGGSQAVDLQGCAAG